MRLRRGITSSNVMALLALFFALGGTTIAGAILAGGKSSPESVCVPTEGGQGVVTPKHGACKSGYTLTGVGREGPDGTGLATTQAHAAPPQPHRRRHRRSIPGGGPSNPQSIDTITLDGAVLVLEDGSVYSVDSGYQSTVSSWSSGNSIALGAAEDRLTNLSRGKSVSVTKVGDSAEANPYANTGEHALETSSADGSVVVLDDGSIWEVSAADQSTAARWTHASFITVNEGSSTPGYALVNTDNNSVIEANYIGAE